MLEPLARELRRELATRFVKMHVGTEKVIMNFYPMWRSNTVDPDWDYLMRVLTVRKFDFQNGQHAIATSSSPVGDARSLGRALRRLIKQPVGWEESWHCFIVEETNTPSDSNTSDLESSLESSPRSAPHSVINIATNQTDRNDDEEALSEFDINKFIDNIGEEAPPITLPSPHGGFSSSKRATPNPLNLQLNRQLLGLESQGPSPQTDSALFGTFEELGDPQWNFSVAEEPLGFGIQQAEAAPAFGQVENSGNLQSNPSQMYSNAPYFGNPYGVGVSPLPQEDPNAPYIGNPYGAGVSSLPQEDPNAPYFGNPFETGFGFLPPMFPELPQSAYPPLNGQANFDGGFFDEAFHPYQQ